jgi:hypothetical protein
VDTLVSNSKELFTDVGESNISYWRTPIIKLKIIYCTFLKKTDKLPVLYYPGLLVP